MPTTLRIPALAPGLNGPKGLVRMHHHAYRKVRDAWCALILAATTPAERRDHAPCAVTITRRVVQRMDVDNAYATAKVPLDALRRAGLLSDDAPECVTSLTVREERVGTRGECGTVIELAEAA